MTGSVRSALIIGSGPVVIGQAAEFDYAGTQACRALRDEGIRSILLNSNPATIMTDPGVADVVYLEPLTLASAVRVLEREQPEGLLAGLGGQTGLNLAVELARGGHLERIGTSLLGTPLEAIEAAEDRGRFRSLLGRIGEPCPPSEIVEGDPTADASAVKQAIARAIERVGLPAIVRPAFTLGGSGSAMVESEPELHERVVAGLRASPVRQVMVERCLTGWLEIEYEVVRDSADTCIAVCSMENVDPLGVHTGDSIVVAPVQTLPDRVHQRLRAAALSIVRALGVVGACNVQFALAPDHSEYAVIEVNPRVSRSSALASKATGYPIARVATQVAVGRRLAEIPNAITGSTVAAFEPALDYVVVKMPRFPFDVFPGAVRSLGSQMQATGEVMAIDRTFGAAFMKALRGLEQAGAGFLAEDAGWTTTPTAPAVTTRIATTRTVVPAPTTNGPPLRDFLAPSDTRAWRLLSLLRRGVPVHELAAATGIAPWFLAEMERLVDVELRLRESRPAAAATGRLPDHLLSEAKRSGFGDRDIAEIAGLRAEAVREQRRGLGLVPGFSMVDTCAAEFAAETPYFYATYAAAGSPPEAEPVPRPAALVIGSGPVRIGQGIEFDCCAVQAAATLRRAGWQALMVNSNPETVSTDFDASSRLYFEPLDDESVLAVADAEWTADSGPPAAMVQFGGQTPLRLAATLVRAGIPLLGSDPDTIERAEDRVAFADLVTELGVPQPPGGMATSLVDAVELAARIGYPVVVRPSFVIGGRAVDVAYGPDQLADRLARATRVSDDRPVRLDAYVEGIEIDVDAVCDGERLCVPALVEHVERAGIHSGDSIGVLPPRRISSVDAGLIVEYLRRVSLALGVRGLVNAQFIVGTAGVMLIEVNPRASRTVPFVSKVTGVPLVDLAVRIALGERLAELGWDDGLLQPPPVACVKAPVFSTHKLRNADPSVGPAMRSTGEVIGIHADPDVAMAKALLAASLRPPTPGPGGAVAVLSIADRDKPWLAELAGPLARAGYRFAATNGTAAALARLGYHADRLDRLEGRDPGRSTRVIRMGAGEPPAMDTTATAWPSIEDAVRSPDVRLVVNTPSADADPVRDAGAIRRAAIEAGVLCITAIETAIEAARSLDPAVLARLDDVRPLAEWLAAGREPAAGRRRDEAAPLRRAALPA